MDTKQKPNGTGQDRDDEFNRAQQYYDREFNDIAKNFNNEDGDSDRSGGDAMRNTDDLANREKNPDTSFRDKNNLKDSEGAPWKTNVAPKDEQPERSTKASFWGQRKKGIIGAIIAVTGLGGLFGLITGPSFALIHWKEVSVNKFVDQLTAMEPRSMLIMRKKVTSGPEVDCTVIKVRCRFNGISQKELDKLQKAGFEVKTTPKRLSPTGKLNVNELIYTNETGEKVKVTADNFDQLMRESRTFRKSIHSAYRPKFAVYADKKMRTLLNKLRIYRGNNYADAKDDKDFRKKEREVISGRQVDVNGHLLANNGQGDTSQLSQAEQAQLAERAETLGEISENVTTEAEAMVENFQNPDIAIEDFVSDPESAEIKELENAAVSGGKGAIKGAVLGPIAAADAVCGAYNMLRAVSFGAKMLAAEDFIRFGYGNMNVADTTKYGDSQVKAVSYFGQKLITPDKDGKTFSEGFSYNYAANGTIGDPTAMFRYKLGGGLTGKLSGVKSTIDKAGGDSLCGVVNNPFVQGGAFLAYIAGTFFTGGTLSAGSIAFSASTAGVVAVAQAIAEPMLIRLVAGTVVTGDEVGARRSDAAMIGIQELNARGARARGMMPLTKEEALAYDQQAVKVAAQLKEESLEDSSPLDVNNPYTITGTLAASVVPFAYSPVQNGLSTFTAFAANPIGSLASVAGNINPTVRAQSPEELAMCGDPEYEQLNLATYPSCVVRMGMNLDQVGAPEYDPDAVIEYMYTNRFIDAEGIPVPDSEYDDFLKNCTNTNTPYSPNPEKGSEKQCIEQKGTQKQNMFRWYTFDGGIDEGMLEQWSGEKLSIDGTAPEASNPATGNANLITGPRAELNNRLLNNPLFTTDSNAPRQDITNGTAKDPVVQLLLTLVEELKVPIRVSVIKTGHDNCSDSGYTSNHYSGLAVDIANEEVAKTVVPWLYNNRANLNLNELIFSPMPPGTSTLKNGEHSAYPAGTLNSHRNHIHVSIKGERVLAGCPRD
ncbi:hypothetical protein CYG49_02940 [Candidatus Saccharibacteria bacterium]|nr:MAG: hypothetical protein CYG49_02940 [Candidatus Saccharibacteria bacterium]